MQQRDEQEHNGQRHAAIIQNVSEGHQLASRNGECMIQNGSILSLSGFVFLETGRCPSYNSPASFLASECPCLPKCRALPSSDSTRI